MFDVGFAEIVLLFGLGLIILGPEKLPRVAAQLAPGALLLSPAAEHPPRVDLALVGGALGRVGRLQGRVGRQAEGSAGQEAREEPAPRPHDLGPQGVRAWGAPDAGRTAPLS